MGRFTYIAWLLRLDRKQAQLLDWVTISTKICLSVARDTLSGCARDQTRPACAGGPGDERAIFIYYFYQEEVEMTLSSPKMITWVIALILGVVGILAQLMGWNFLTENIGFWLVSIAFLLLLVASVAKGI